MVTGLQSCVWSGPFDAKRQLNFLMLTMCVCHPKMLTTTLLYLFLGELGGCPSSGDYFIQGAGSPCRSSTMGGDQGKSRLHTAFKSMLGIGIEVRTWVLFGSFFHVLRLFDWLILHNKTQLMLRYRIHDETSIKTRLKIGPTLTKLWLLEVHVCRFLKWIDMSSQWCAVWSVK